VEAAETLSHHLWNLRERLELLVYSLNAQQLFLASGRLQFIERAAADVAHTAELVAEMDSVVRASAELLGVDLGLAKTATLSELAQACADTWRTVLAEHRLELSRLRAEVEQMVRLNKEAMRRATAGGPGGYDASGAGVNFKSNKPRLNAAG
jgi:hypothetical protein